MKKLPALSLVVAAGAAALAVVSSAAGTTTHPSAEPALTVSSRYVVVGAGAILTLKNTVYVAGVSRVAAATGSATVVSAASGQTEAAMPRVAGGSVETALPDGAGGWYIGGTFTSVGGVGRPGLAHVSSDGTLDTAFAPPDLGQVRALALDGGRLYAGGVQALAAAPWFQPVLSALDPATGAQLSITYPPLAHTDQSLAFGVIALAAGDGRLFAAFNGDNGIAAYDEGSGALLWSQPGTPSFGKYAGPAAVALAGGKLLVGGQISRPGSPVNLEELDPATGSMVGEPAVDGPVADVATVAGTAYVLAQNPQVLGLRVWKVELASGSSALVAAVKGASSIASDGTTLYVAGQVAVRGDVRVYSLDLGQSKPALHALAPLLVGGGVNALALQGDRLFVGGSFLGMGGVKRGGLAAFNARTGSLLPWRPLVQGGRIGALAGSGKTIYLGGSFKRIAGVPRAGLAAVSALGSGKVLRWHPRLSQGSIGSLAVAKGRVFAGGSLKSYTATRSTPFKHLAAFSARTGRQLPFKSRLGHVSLLAVYHRRLLVESTCNQHGQTYSCVTAFRLTGVGRTVWRQSIRGKLSALQTAGSTLYVGGSCVHCRQTSILAALALDRGGARLRFSPSVPLPVLALARADHGVVFAVDAFGAGSTGPYFAGTQALGAVSAGGEVLPWRVDFPANGVPLSANDTEGGAGNFGIAHVAAVPGGLVASGSFSWIGPADDPAPGTLVWIR
jgi:outer membrane protein assembly factor BamB